MKAILSSKRVWFFLVAAQFAALAYQVNLYWKIEEASDRWAQDIRQTSYRYGLPLDADKAVGARDIARQVRAERVNSQIDSLRRKIRAAADDAQTNIEYEGECTGAIKEYFKARGFQLRQEERERRIYSMSETYTVCIIDWAK